MMTRNGDDGLDESLLNGLDSNDDTIEVEELESASVLLRTSSKRSVPKLLSISSSIVICLGFLSLVEYGIVMPSLSEYVKTMGQSHVFYGITMGIFSIARLICMPILGYWSDRRPMIEPFFFSIVAAILGNFLYGLAYGAGSAWLILVGRVFVGFGAANGALSMAYVARITDNQSRTKAMAMLSGINLIGVIIGPATNIIVNDVDTKWNNMFVFNHFTNPGFMMIILLVFALLLLLVTFKEPPSKPHMLREPSFLAAERRMTNLTGTPDNLSGLATPIGSISTMSGAMARDDLQEPLLDTMSIISELQHPEVSFKEITSTLIDRSLWIHFVISFMSNFLLSELETALPALTRTAFDWDTVAISIMYAVIGIFVALTLIVVMMLSSRIEDRTFITIGIVGYYFALSIACFSLRERKPSFTMFLIVTFLLIGACPLTGSPNMSLYSKRLQECEKSADNMGLYIGLLQGVNGLARAFAPMYAGFALSVSDSTSSSLMVYIGPLIVVFLSSFIFYIYFARFRTKSLLA